ncbi:hypothetical protein NXT3_PB00107 (plasmid) [Sinorhizobium fredii]|uniref:Uncharacterized protein n=1 Tax=Rhizobium fredii TaxID=380 RepID=A0A2L0HDE7_RHIFR|nr:hypothetical protein NXT3_PB00107 [Sinorhizobium fredii]
MRERRLSLDSGHTQPMGNGWAESIISGSLGTMLRKIARRDEDAPTLIDYSIDAPPFSRSRLRTMITHRWHATPSFLL